MLINHTAEKLRSMKLPVMAGEYLRQSESPNIDALSFDERVGMMADAEWLSRENNRVRRYIKDANLRFSTACFADIDYRPSRKLDRAYIVRLTDFSWVRESKNIIFTGATGTGKTFLSCAFGVEACRMGLRVLFYRVSRLVNEMAAMTDHNDIVKFLAKLNRADILILDDWGLATLSPLESRLLHEVFEDRCNERSIIISAQLPVAKWHGLFEDSTIADAVLDRVIHASYRIELHGPSMRSIMNRPTGDKEPNEGSAPYGVQDQKTHPQRDKNTAMEQDGDNNA